MSYEREQMQMNYNVGGGDDDDIRSALYFRAQCEMKRVHSCEYIRDLHMRCVLRMRANGVQNWLALLMRP